MRQILLVAALLSAALSFSQTQLEMNKAAGEKFKKADAELNVVYKRLIKILDKKDRQLLVQAEKDWLKFRASHCNFEGGQFEGGSIQPLVYANCMEAVTNERIAQLKQNIKDRAQ